MTIEFIQGNIFDYRVSAYVNPVNTKGIAGAGLAKDFKDKYPESYKNYKIRCENRRMPFSPGELYFDLINEKPSRYIIYFATKDDWKNNSRLEWVTQGLHSLRYNLEHYFPDIYSIAVPALGCGLGGLEWEIVREKIFDYLGGLKITVYVFEPK